MFEFVPLSQSTVHRASFYPFRVCRVARAHAPGANARPLFLLLHHVQSRTHARTTNPHSQQVCRLHNHTHPTHPPHARAKISTPCVARREARAHKVHLQTNTAPREHDDEGEGALALAFKSGKGERETCALPYASLSLPRFLPAFHAHTHIHTPYKHTSTPHDTCAHTPCSRSVFSSRTHT